MKKFNYLLLLCFIVIIVSIGTYFLIFSIPSSPQLNVSQGSTYKKSLQCYKNKMAKPVDTNGELELLVWNIFKQGNQDWKEKLTLYSQHSNLALLQEVSMNDDFKAYAKNSSWFSSHVDAFRAFGVSTGVLTLSKTSPLVACAYVKLEPWIQLPKSGIYAVFGLSDQRELVVVNMHSVNFTYGIMEYEQQISALSDALKDHEGPVIFAGDLNAWSEERVIALKTKLSQLGLIEVSFIPDNRKPIVNGMALDYVFYRELTLVNAESLTTTASDHNPLLVRFKL